MSIVRIGLSETEKFAEGWEAIFGKKPREASAPKKAKASAAKKPKAKKKKKK